MTKNGPSAMSGNMSREDRKNLEIAKMIERQEQLRKKREEKNKLKVLNSENNNSGGKPGNSSSGQRKQKLMKKKTSPEQKAENSKVQIHVVFSDTCRTQSSNNRYFIERKQTVEERQRQEQEELWTRLAQAQFMSQRSGHLGQPGMGYFINTGGDTGGNYEAGDDYSGSSYLSSASKRQRVEDWGPQAQNQGLSAQQALLLQQQSMMQMWGGGDSQLLEQQMSTINQPALPQGYNYNAPLEEQSPALSQQMPNPSSETPFVNPISAEDCSAGVDKKSECAELPKVNLIVDIPESKVPDAKGVSEVTTGLPAKLPDSPMDDAQSILELTKNLQTKLAQKRISAAPPAADASPEPKQTPIKESQS